MPVKYYRVLKYAALMSSEVKTGPARRHCSGTDCYWWWRFGNCCFVYECSFFILFESGSEIRYGKSITGMVPWRDGVTIRKAVNQIDLLARLSVVARLL